MLNNFKTFVEIETCLEKHGSIYVPESFDWAKEIGKMLPNLGLDLPTVKKQAKIDLVMDKKNPIYIQLADGTKLFFTHDEFKRISGKPERGRTMIVTMQRLSDDKNELPSQIMGCQVI